MTTQLASVPRKLPAWSTVSTCYSLVARNLGQLVRIAWFLLLIMMPMYAVTYWLSWPWSSEATGDIGGLVNQLFTSLPSLIELPFLASIAVAWPPAAAPGAVCGHPVFSVRCSGLAVRCVVAWVVVLSTAPFYYSPSSSPGPIEIGLMPSPSMKDLRSSRRGACRVAIAGGWLLRHCYVPFQR
jgi:hypothetical protein